MDADVSEVFLKLNPNDMSDHYLVSVAPMSALGTGQFSPPVNLTLPAGLPISVQPNLAEVIPRHCVVILLISTCSGGEHSLARGAAGVPGLHVPAAELRHVLLQAEEGGHLRQLRLPPGRGD